jgi:hypothetical protein
MTNLVIVLLIVYQLKHFIADYPLQGQYMLGKFKGGFDWILPLMAHSGVHAVMTYIITLFVKPELAVTLALVDGIIHFIMDRIKASPDLLGKYKNFTKKEFETEILPDINSNKSKEKIKSNVYFWWSLGFDQMVHHLTHYLIIWMLVS